MATENVPSHHIQQELCTTRPSYRQGRELKAVKVYTVNQESKFLLIQGVPTVGASRDLIKLCALYGPVEEYRILDDYPLAEKFTEVYWVKFSRTQSARFAKRKLDNQGFFGGSLHVCYAPEYESVEDTREKLQERRRVIANKTRQQQESPGTVSTTESCTDETGKDMDYIAHGETLTDWKTKGNSDRQIINTALPSEDTDNPFNNGRLVHTPIETPYFNLEIPPPPHVMYAGGLPTRFQPQKFDHARVPSSHSTLPHGYDPRAHNPGYTPHQPTGTNHVEAISHHSQTPDKHSSQTITDKIPAEGIQLKNIKFKPNGREKDKVSAGPELGGIAKVPEDLLKNRTKLQPEKVVLKDFKKTGSQPKFIPRQAEAALKRKLESPTDDVLSKQIRRNAVRLRETVQGPTLPDGSLQSKLPASPADVSVERTITSIRDQVTQFSDVFPMKKLKPS